MTAGIEGGERRCGESGANGAVSMSLATIQISFANVLPLSDLPRLKLPLALRGMCRSGYVYSGTTSLATAAGAGVGGSESLLVSSSVGVSSLGLWAFGASFCTGADCVAFLDDPVNPLTLALGLDDLRLIRESNSGLSL